MRFALALAALALGAAPAADVVDRFELDADIAQLHCDFARKCNKSLETAYCGASLDHLKKAWDKAKAAGTKTPSVLERGDWDGCRKAFASMDCKKHPLGFSQFYKDRSNAACNGYEEFVRKGGKYAPKQ